MSKMRICTALIWLGLCQLGTGQDAALILQDAQRVHMRNLDSCIYYADLVIELTAANEKDTLTSQALFFKGWNTYLKGNYSEAIKIFKLLIAHPASSPDQMQYIRSVGRIGVSLKELGVQDSSMYYLLEYDRLIDAHIGETAIEAKLELGELYRVMGRMEESNAFIVEAIERARRSDKRMDKMLSLYYYLDNNASDIGKPESQEYLDAYLELTGKIQMDGTVDYTHSGMRLIQFSGAEKLALLEADVMRLDSAGRGKGYLILIQYLIREYLNLDRHAEAERWALNGLAHARYRHDLGFVLDFQMSLAQIAEEMHESAKALQYTKAYYSLKDSLFQEASIANADSLRVQYETAKKDRQLADQELALQRGKSQRNRLYVGLGLLIWVGGFTMLYQWVRNRQKQKIADQERQIQEQRIQQLEHEKRILAMNSMLEGQEAERMRIAKDLHDGLGGLLGTVKAHFSVIQEEIDKLDKINIYQKVDELIDTASAEVRRISHNMAPHALRFGGLKDALFDLSNQLKAHDLEVTFEWNGDDDRLDRTLEVTLFRIAQELTTNAVKYASASHLLIQANRYDDQFNLIVEDDGMGFKLDEAFASGGLGLKSVQSRVEYIKGSLDINASPGDGTTITVQVGLRDAEA